MYICPTKQKCSICILDYTQNTFFCLGKFLMWLADDQSSSITKGSIYYIKHMYIQPFSMEVDWWEICIKWKYLQCFIFVDTVFFTLWGGYIALSFLICSMLHTTKFFFVSFSSFLVVFFQVSLTGSAFTYSAKGCEFRFPVVPYSLSTWK